VVREGKARAKGGKTSRPIVPTKSRVPSIGTKDVLNLAMRYREDVAKKNRKKGQREAFMQGNPCPLSGPPNDKDRGPLNGFE